MRNNGVMSEPEVEARNAFAGVIGVWVAALLGAVALGIFVPEQWRVPWLVVSFGAVILVSFAVQLWYGRTQGFILRVAGSATGALLLMGTISLGFGLAALVPV